jgi:uncharacterized alkaline shock family protein YloU
MIEGEASISTEILARYASDAARAVDGVRDLAGRRGCRVDEEGRVQLRLEVAWGSPIPTVGRTVQERVRDYLAGMAQLEEPVVDVVVERVGPVR